MVLSSFGVIFLSFGGVMLFLGLLGLHYGSRESLGTSGLYGSVFLIIGVVLFGAGWFGGRQIERRPGDRRDTL
jgi:Ca2+/Na+ antiporter